MQSCGLERSYRRRYYAYPAPLANIFCLWSKGSMKKVNSQILCYAFIFCMEREGNFSASIFFRAAILWPMNIFWSALLLNIFQISKTKHRTTGDDKHLKFPSASKVVAFVEFARQQHCEQCFVKCFCEMKFHWFINLITKSFDLDRVFNSLKAYLRRDGML